MKPSDWNGVCVQRVSRFAKHTKLSTSALKENTMCVVRRFALSGLVLLCFCGNFANAEDKPPDASAAASTAQSAPDPRLVPPSFDRADNAWMLVSSALVLMMTAPGLALF